MSSRTLDPENNLQDALAAIKRRLQNAGHASVDAYEPEEVIESSMLHNVEEPPFDPSDDPTEAVVTEILLAPQVKPTQLETEALVDDCHFEPEEKPAAPAAQAAITPVDPGFQHMGHISKFVDLERIYLAVELQALQFARDGKRRSRAAVHLSTGEKVEPFVYHRSGLAYVQTKKAKYLQQNPNTASRYADLARQGHFIIWIIDLKGQYLGYVMDGQVFSKRASSSAYRR